ncbi:MAG TPA: hypothetical protein DDW52_06195 [Planctomycetaceae bacterium]|nr:hypothetical protein [Planctomycetaceae bacterium]
MRSLPDLHISARHFLGVGAAITVGLTVAHGVSHLAAAKLGENRITSQLLEWFSLDGEGNFPALFSSLLLLVSAASFLCIGLTSKTDPAQSSIAKYWKGLACIFCFLAIDEAVLIHEKFDNNTLLSWVETNGFLAWPWVILYAVLVLFFVAIYFRFWWNLEKSYRFAYALTAAVYVSAALGLEMVGAFLYTNSSPQLVAMYSYVMALEELLEMLAIVALITINLDYLSRHFGRVALAIERFSITSKAEA